MSFKSYLQALISAVIGKVPEAAAPAGQPTTVTFSEYVVSPCNGYARLYSTAGTDREPKIETSGLSYGGYLPSSYGGTGYLPVKKGQNVRFFGTGINSSNANISFTSMIGGGGLKLIFELLFKEVRYV